jgi:hypothetical protein
MQATPFSVLVNCIKGLVQSKKDGGIQRNQSFSLKFRHIVGETELSHKEG